jgi:hypothetical protein|tara:strand:- start:1514 stop:2251 length:738 start_codon:yes stop_codon:yes gene_type:complete
MINIDSVYQKVLTLANKEQRGYITPQEFSLLADQAQLEIFEQYFYDMEQLKRRQNDNYEYGSLDTIFEKISTFETNANLILAQQDSDYYAVLPSDLYKLGVVSINNFQAERVTEKQARLYSKTKLGPNSQRPLYTIKDLSTQSASEKIIKFIPNPIYRGSTIVTECDVVYIRKPKNPNWGYVVVASKPLFDASPNKTQHFEISASDEVELVYKILKLAGVTIQRDDIAAAGQAFETSQIQQEKQQ